MWGICRMQMMARLPENSLERMQQSQVIPEIVRELVTHELIYVPPPPKKTRVQSPAP
jgi:hypothetical protein